MLKVTIELHPFGDSRNATTISEIYIANKGVVKTSLLDNDKKCKYHAWINYNPSEVLFEKDRKKPDAVVTHWRSRGAEVLVAAVLDKLDGPNPTR